MFVSHTDKTLSIYFILAKLIFILGPPAVGRNELKRRLMAYAPNRFEEVVPCKSDNFLKIQIFSLSQTGSTLARTYLPPAGCTLGLSRYFYQKHNLRSLFA